jgi:HD-like signal output (HDOD) protein
VREAVAYLGLETLRALALSAETFREFGVTAPIPGFDLDGLQLHCARVAALARAISERSGDADEAFAAGLLHDVGLLVMACQEPDELGEMIALARAQDATDAVFG